MAYNTVTFVAFEQPTAAKMNLLGENDAGFRDGTNISNDVILARHIDWDTTGANGGIWGEELGRHLLGTPGDTLQVTSFTARKYLTIISAVHGTGGTCTQRLRFNNDSATNYAQWYSVNFGASESSSSATGIELNSIATEGMVLSIAHVVNITNKRKVVLSKAADDNNASATTTSNNLSNYGKWDNTAAQITRVDVLNNGTGDFNTGSELVILGHN